MRRGVPPDFFAQYGAAGRRNGTQRVSVMPLPARGGGDSNSDADAHSDACPTAWLLGIDLTPSPGLRGPTDFFGRADAQLLREVDTLLGDLSTHHR